nr:MAG: hypothetical protein [Bacteriophage sp.]
MTNYVSLNVSCQSGKTEIKINGKLVKTAAEIDAAIKKVQPGEHSELLKQLLMLVRAIEC